MTLLIICLFQAIGLLSSMASAQVFDYSITTTWDNQTINHAPIEIQLSTKDNNLELVARGPFFNDPPAPKGPPGPFWELWNYEVVEAFFLGNNDRYLEVELSPHGQYLLLMLNGKSNAVADCLPVSFVATIDNKTSVWEGRALIPQDYFPPNVTKFNGYAIHGTDPNRTYESLYPCPYGNYTNPDFHRLEYFEAIDFAALFPANPDSSLSPIWQDAIDGKLNYTCTGK